MTMLEYAGEGSPGYRLMNEFQRGFPLCPAPFAELAAVLGMSEGAVLRLLEQLRREGAIARVGAVFSPKRIGASTMVAAMVAPERLAGAMEAVNRFPEANHLHVRDHGFSLWFVVTAGSEGRLQAALGAIGRAAGVELHSLPMIREFCSDTGSTSGEAATGVPLEPVCVTPLATSSVLDEIGRRLVIALQEGLPLFIRPFSVLASRVGCDESEVLERIRRWCKDGVIKRFGVVKRYPAADDGTTALLVQDVPDDAVVGAGLRLAGEAGVALCYQRLRALPAWPYNLFCSLHGATVDEVRGRIAGLRSRLGFSAYPYDVLFSRVRPHA